MERLRPQRGRIILEIGEYVRFMTSERSHYSKGMYDNDVTYLLNTPSLNETYLKLWTQKLFIKTHGLL
jgi:hypothetical protein